jgi:hypothetical protein
MNRGMKNGFDQAHFPRPAQRAIHVACALLMAGSVNLCMAESLKQTTFSSPEEASRALVSAVQTHDERAVARILGGAGELISSNDKTEDTLDRERFTQRYQQMHRWLRESEGIMTLYIGAENWPFPIPLVSHEGVWQFDSEAGSREILFRRIGENEVTAIGMCDTLLIAETRPGTDSEADQLVKTFLPELEHASKGIAFHGYYFHVLTNQRGSFAAIAYPAKYRASGVMTFIVTQDGNVLEKDLGPKSAKIASTMTGYHPDEGWTPAESKP